MGKISKSRKQAKFKGTNIWDYIVLEGFCGYSFMKDKYTKEKEMKRIKDKIDWKWLHSDEGWEKVKNRCYIKAKRPRTCKMIPQSSCLSDKCKFFLWSDVSKETKVLEKKDLRIKQ